MPLSTIWVSVLLWTLPLVSIAEDKPLSEATLAYYKKAHAAFDAFCDELTQGELHTILMVPAPAGGDGNGLALRESNLAYVREEDLVHFMKCLKTPEGVVMYGVPLNYMLYPMMNRMPSRQGHHLRAGFVEGRFMVRFTRPLQNLSVDLVYDLKFTSWMEALMLEKPESK